MKALGLRGTVILACLLVLAVTAYGVAQDLGLVEPPAHAAPARKPSAGQPRPSRAATADIPAGYLRLYRSGRRPLPHPLAGAGGHRQGRVRPRPGPPPRGPVGQQLGRGLWAHAARLCAGQQGRQRLGPLRPRPPPRPRQRHPGRRPLPGRPRRPPQPGPGPVRLQPLLGLRGQGQAPSPAATPAGVGGGERPDRPAPGPRAWAGPSPGVVAGCRDLRRRAGPQPQPGRAERTARRTRCPACGTRTARRLPGTTSPATDLALARGRPRARRPPPLAARPLTLPRRAGRR